MILRDRLYNNSEESPDYSPLYFRSPSNQVHHFLEHLVSRKTWIAGLVNIVVAVVAIAIEPMVGAQVAEIQKKIKDPASVMVVI